MTQRYLVAPDKFKGSLTAREVADAVATGLRRAGQTDVITLPLADGGDGSVDTSVAAGFAPRAVSAHDALGRRRETRVALDGRRALVEVASTCGISGLDGGLDPLRASSYGLGEAIAAAAMRGGEEIVVGLGGSASTDAGCGMLAALGARFRDRRGDEFVPCGGTLEHIASIDMAGLAWLHGIRIVGASDVDNPLVGVTGAAEVFAPQKGATPAEVAVLDRGLRHAAAVLSASAPPVSPAMPRTGSAGGIGYAIAVLGGELVSGAELFLDLLRFRDHARGADVVVTGEGSLDAQTLGGKLIAAVCSAAGSSRVVAVAGRCTLSESDAAALGVDSVHALADLTEQDTAHDAELSRRLLADIGSRIAASLPPRAPLPPHPAVLSTLAR